MSDDESSEKCSVTSTETPNETSEGTSITPEEAISKAKEGIEYLKACEDFSTEKTCKNLKKVEDAYFELNSLNDKAAFGKFVADSDFGLLFPKMWTLTGCLCHFTEKCQFHSYTTEVLFKYKRSVCQSLINLRRVLCFILNMTNVSPEFAASLGKCGAISLLFDELKKIMAMETQVPDSEDCLHFYDFKLYILGILHNAIRHCSSNLTFYRSSDAVSILKVFLLHDEDEEESEEEEEEGVTWWQLFSLLILAYVVTDDESEMFASEVVGVGILANLLCAAVQSDDHRVYLILGFSAYELLDAINHLARNDANKKVVATEGAIPHIVQMLQEDFTSDDQRVAAEALWNLAFISEIRKSDEFQKAIPGRFL